MQFPFAVVNLAPVSVRGKLTVPRTDKTIEGLCFFSERRVWLTRRKHVNHRLSRRRAAGACLRHGLSDRDCAHSQEEHDACDSNLECPCSERITHTSSLLALRHEDPPSERARRSRSSIT